MDKNKNKPQITSRCDGNFDDYSCLSTIKSRIKGPVIDVKMQIKSSLQCLVLDKMRSVGVALLAVFGVFFSISVSLIINCFLIIFIFPQQVAYCSPHYDLVELDEEFFNDLVKILLKSIWRTLTDKERKAYQLELMEEVRELRDKLHMGEFEAMNYLAPMLQ
jgi:hypothetical protein